MKMRRIDFQLSCAAANVNAVTVVVGENEYEDSSIDDAGSVWVDRKLCGMKKQLFTFTSQLVRKYRLSTIYYYFLTGHMICDYVVSCFGPENE